MKMRFALLGLLGAVTVQAANPAALLQKFHELDKDHDGRLSTTEMGDAQWMSMLDLDKDGYVTLPEATEYFTQLLGGIKAGPEKPGALGGKLAGALGLLGKAAATGGLTAPATQAGSAASADMEASLQEAPAPLNAAESGIGSLIPDVSLPDLDHDEVRLSLFKDSPALVLACVSGTCPVSKRYLPTLGAMAKEFAAKNIPFVLVTGETVDAPFRAALAAANLSNLPCLQDTDGKLRRALGSTALTDCFVLDAARTLVYRGAVDDQYGLGYSRESARHHYLADALNAVLAHRLPAIAATEAPGCAVDLGSAPPATTAAPTYYGEVARIMQAHCQECHRAGGVAPFPLENYEQVSAKSGMIRKMVTRGLMPPWFAAAPAKGQHSPWANDRSLGERERTQLLAWLDQGKPAGEASLAPVPRSYPAEWQMGTPDLVLQIPEPIEVKATGVMPYQNVVVDPGLDGARWVRGFEVLPTAREVVHHILIFIEDKDAAKTRGSRLAREGGGFLAAYVPGNNWTVYPEGFAKELPANSRLRFQIHYTPNGTATRDQVRLGLLFSDTPPEHVVRIAEIANPRLNIPPQAENHAEKASLPVPADVMVLSLMPHMHMRGKAFNYTAQLPDGSARSLLDVPRYDFNWQLGYRFATPVRLPAGSKIEATGRYDNSANNPANPDPNKNVRWGQQTTDEMMIGYVEYCFVTPENPRLSKAN